MTAPESDNVALVKVYLRAQNLEQIGRLEEAIELYEQGVAGRFDSTGPYDRLIAIYSDQGRHGEVVRVAEEAIANVHTHSEKKAWYERMRGAAKKAMAKAPRAVPKPPRPSTGSGTPDGGRGFGG
ncbi:MAG: tetratricopeptide repeat protein [Actinobacteria bacterium]|nr:tetratricopeptide repeat protein [Actinomycetota bacterium]